MNRSTPVFLCLSLLGGVRVGGRGQGFSLSLRDVCSMARLRVDPRASPAAVFSVGEGPAPFTWPVDPPFTPLSRGGTRHRRTGLHDVYCSPDVVDHRASWEERLSGRVGNRGGRRESPTAEGAKRGGGWGRFRGRVTDVSGVDRGTTGVRTGRPITCRRGPGTSLVLRQVVDTGPGS